MAPTVFDVPETVCEAEADADAVHEECISPFACGFCAGAAWYAAGMAVCAFLADLADMLNACYECGGCRIVDCDACGGTGRRNQ